MTEFNKPFPELKIKKSKAAAARILLKSLTYSFALFGLLFILLLVVLANMLGSPSVMVHPVPSRAVLTLDLDRPYPESRSDDLLAEFSEEPSLSFYDLIKAVNVAALDNKVQALVADVGNTSLGLAQIQDLREAVKARFVRPAKRLISILRAWAVSAAVRTIIIWHRPLTRYGCSRIPKSALPV